MTKMKIAPRAMQNWKLVSGHVSDMLGELRKKKSERIKIVEKDKDFEEKERMKFAKQME